MITIGGVVGGGTAGELAWYRGRACNDGACVELAASGDAVVVRSTENPDATFTMSREEWREFLVGAKEGIFDEV